ncbi:MAG: hypothetical protein EA407_05155 [Rhodobacteraceae bacterium]|nr:MAG: hypothetical protein EA407_05155 [Paracoccaceae bacterium]
MTMKQQTMFSNVLKRGRRAADAYAQREEGSMIVLGLFFFVCIILIAGLAVDFMRYESKRIRVQATADRAALAAATLREGGDREAIVRDFFRAEGLLDYLVEPIEIESGLNSARVLVRTRPQVNTIFMRMVGQDTLISHEVSGALEQVSNIEISLVLDISGSMRWTDSIGIPRITRLRGAARNFVSQVLDDEVPDVTTISIIPYAGTVNPGQQVFELLGGNAWHDYSHCPDLPRSVFDSTGLPDLSTIPQAPHFMNWPIDWPTMDWGWCPIEANSILYHSSNEDELHDYLTNMRLHDGTGTHYGMRWGLALLDPDSNWLTGQLVGSNRVDSVHLDRPVAWDDDGTRKVVVLMTDGLITDQHRPRRPGTNTVFGTNGVFPTEDEQDTLDNTHILGLSNDWRRRITRRSENLQDFFSACDMAKQNGVVIYTIAFETNTQGQDEMRNCASTPNHYFNAVGGELDQVFAAIAASIQALRLVE